MKKRILVVLAGSVLVLGFSLWGWIRYYDDSSYRPSPNEIETLPFETVRPGLDATSAVSSRRMYIGEEFTVWLWVRYDPETYALDERSIRESVVAPFEITSVSSRVLQEAEKTVRLFGIRVQCVTCTPNKTHELSWSLLRYENFVSKNSGFIRVNAEIVEPYLFNPYDVSFRSYDDERVIFSRPFVASEIMFGGGVFSIILGLGVLAMFFKRWGRTAKTIIADSSRAAFLRDLKKLHDRFLLHSETDPHTFLSELYFTLAIYISREYRVDVVAGDSVPPLLPEELSFFVEEAKKAYTKGDVTKEELEIFFDRINAFFSQNAKEGISHE